MAVAVAAAGTTSVLMARVSAIVLVVFLVSCVLS